jgi:hypothetical protein
MTEEARDRERARRREYMRKYRARNRKRLRRYNRDWMWRKRNVGKAPGA